MLRASHLFYALLVLISVFIIATIAGPSRAVGDPLGTMIVGCDPERLDQPCAAPAGDVLADGQVRVS
jgi:hypothetical protein